MLRLMGHRGARDIAPENTMRSFEALMQSGLNVLEFDIHESLDGNFFIHHDDTLDRTTTATGPIGKKTTPELEVIKTKEGDSIPRLEEALKLANEYNCELQIELKSDANWANLYRILNSYNQLEAYTIISFNHKRLLELKSNYIHLKTTCLLYALPIDPIHIIKSTNANGLSLNVNLIDEELVNKCHQNNFLVTAWNANDKETFDKMTLMDIDFLGTDVPYTAKNWT